MEDYAKFNMFKLWSAVLKFGDSTIRLGGVLVWPLLYWWLFYISCETLPTKLIMDISLGGGILLTLSSAAFLIRWPIYFKKLKNAANKIQYCYSELIDYCLNMKSTEEIKKHPQPQQLTDFYNSLVKFSTLLHLNFMEKWTQKDNNLPTNTHFKERHY